MRRAAENRRISSKAVSPESDRPRPPEAEPTAPTSSRRSAPGCPPATDVRRTAADRGRRRTHGSDGAAGRRAAAAATVEPSLSDYSTIGAYLHELRRYPLMTREEEHDVAVQFCKTARAARWPRGSSPRTCGWS